MNIEAILIEAAKAAAKKAVEDLAAEGIEFAADAIDAAADALHGALSQYPRVVHAKRLEVVDERARVSCSGSPPPRG